MHKPIKTGVAYISFLRSREGLPARTSLNIPPKIAVINPITTAIGGVYPSFKVLAAAVIENKAIPNASKYSKVVFLFERLFTTKKAKKGVMVAVHK